jgi:hypothetical protein
VTVFVIILTIAFITIYIVAFLVAHPYHPCMVFINVIAGRSCGRAKICVGSNITDLLLAPKITILLKKVC